MKQVLQTKQTNKQHQRASPEKTPRMSASFVRICAKRIPKKMHFEILAQPMRQIKNTEKGVLEMCKRYDETFLEGFEDGEKAGLEQGISQQIEKTVLRLIDRGETDVNVLIDITCSNIDAIQKILNKHNIVLAQNA